MSRLKPLRILAGALALALVLPLAGFAQGTGSTGNANFTRYVAVGDSLTAGFMSGGLFQTAQQNSYPVLVWRQATGQATGFEQPLVSDPGIPAALELRSLAPLTIAPRAGRGNPLNLNLQRPYNNLAVPGADVHDVVATVTDNGGLHDLILRGLGTQLNQARALQPTFVTIWIGNNDVLHDLILRGLGTQLNQARALQPTFVTIWIGNNDVLGAATSGRVIEGVTITPVAQFEADFKAIVAGLVGANTRAAIANIPEVTGIPFVTTVPRVVVNPATSQPVLINGQPVPLIGPNGPLGAGDRVLLTATTELAQGKGIPVQLGGSGQPLSDGAVLSAAEIATITARVQAFNNIIRSEAARVGAAFVDINSEFRVVADQGINVGGITFTENFLTGGVFSYDGVHPNAFGYAFIANLFIDAINEQFGGEIEPVNLYPFIFGPQSAVSPSSAFDGAAANEADTQGGTSIVMTPSAIRNLFWALDIKTDDAPKKGKGKRKGRK